MTALPGGAASAQPARLRARTLDVRADAAGATIAIGGRTLVNFCSNDYLGLAASPLLRAAAIEAIARHGVGAGSAALRVRSGSRNKSILGHKCPKEKSCPSS